MSLLSVGERVRAVSVQLVVLMLAVLVSGCATTVPGVQLSIGYGPAGESRFAGLSSRPWVETEADGREAQLPPRKRPDPALDDPSEPFSPNYGSVEPVPVPQPWTVTVMRDNA